MTKAPLPRPPLSFPFPKYPGGRRAARVGGLAPHARPPQAQDPRASMMPQSQTHTQSQTQAHAPRTRP